MAQNLLVLEVHPSQDRRGSEIFFLHSVGKLESLVGDQGYHTDLPVSERVKDNHLVGTVHLIGPAERLQRLLEVLIKFPKDSLQSPCLLSFPGSGSLSFLPLYRSTRYGVPTGRRPRYGAE